jgi:photosystem II stability/assembly factor-like uncharacterized protein
VAGHQAKPDEFYFGAAAGGVWKTIDAGWAWRCVSDGFIKRPSIGSLAVATSDPNVVYAGTGEACVRADVSRGDGVYRTVDAGRTWQNCGLADSHHIGRVVINPADPDVVFCAALGHLYGPSAERGVYRSLNGGSSWEAVLKQDANTGAVDIAIDPGNARILFASLWQIRRSPSTLTSGGPGSGLFASFDAGQTWRDLGQSPGFPRGLKGKIGVAVAPGSNGRVWALIEAAQTGLYRSDDWGDTWDLINDQPDLSQRPFYYMHVIAHPTDPDTVFVMNMKAWRSTDGGDSFSTLSLDHGDQHALWISPSDPQRMILSNDGGAVVSIDGGQTWSSRMNQPIAAFYNVVADSERPYRLYGAQQDSTTLSLPSRTVTGLVAADDCFPVGGCESGGIGVTRSLPAVVYAVGYDGTETRFEVDTGRLSDVSAWPEDRIGSDASQVRYRFNWSTPLIVARRHPMRVFCAAQVVFRTDDGGQTWEVISPDLTRGDPSTLGQSGGPITPENYTAEYYGCVVVLSEDPSDEHTLWTGSDDGLVHVTRDGGSTWNRVTVQGLPEWTRITGIEIDPNDSKLVYVTGTRERSDDERATVFMSADGGASWAESTAGLSRLTVCRSIRCDPINRGVVYLATDDGVMVSEGKGEPWQSLQLNLPASPVYDLTIADDDLVAATHGRSIWILEGLQAMAWRRGLTASTGEVHQPSVAPRATITRMADLAVHVEATGDTDHVYISVGDFVKAKGIRSVHSPDGLSFSPIDAGFRLPNQVVVEYHLPNDLPGPVTIRVLDERGTVVRALRPEDADPSRSGNSAGLHWAAWDLRYPPAAALEPERFWFMFGNYLWGPLVDSGTFRIEVVDDRVLATGSLQVDLSTADAQRSAQVSEQVRFLLEVRDRLSSTHAVVARIRSIVALLESEHRHSLPPNSESLRAQLQAAETELVSREVIGPADYHRHPSGLNARLMGLAFRVGESDGPVTGGHRQVLAELAQRQSTIMGRLRELGPAVEALRPTIPDPALRDQAQFPDSGFDYETSWARPAGR